MMIFLTVLFTIFIAEMGDKTQLLLVAMAGKYKISHILTGTWLATVLLNVLAIGVGAALGNYLDMRIIKTVAGIAFFWFAYSIVKGDGDEEEQEKEMKHTFGPVFAIFGSFFIGELGDKTQLSAITLAANYTQHQFSNALYVFLGCTLGLILADLIGLIVGVMLKSKMPTGILNILSFAIFAVFGVASIEEAMVLCFGEGTKAVIGFIGITGVFVLCSLIAWIKRRKAQVLK
ncbi:MAG: TMEM165/GDT1 family protein [Ruminococcus sp.]|nr:TMEM165/GDT1 family protein [Ruminococcus sp.]